MRHFLPFNFLAFLIGFSLVFPVFADACFKQFSSDTAGASVLLDVAQVVANNTPTSLADVQSIVDAEPALCCTCGYPDGFVFYYTYHYPTGNFSSSGTAQYYIGHSVLYVYSSGIAVPPHCSNSIIDVDEVGWDCGGSCSPCKLGCPSGSTVIFDGDATYKCLPDLSPLDAFGNLPAGYVAPEIVLASDILFNLVEVDFVDPAQGTYDDYDSIDLSFLDSTSEALTHVNGTFSVVHSAETVIDNGDGTETATVIKTQVNPDGFSGVSSSVSVKRPSGSNLGTGFNSDFSIASGYEGAEIIDVPSEISVGSSERNDMQLMDFSSLVDGGISRAETFLHDFFDRVQNVEMIAKLRSIMSVPSGSANTDALTVDFGGYGVHSVDFFASDSAMSTLRGVLKVCASIIAVFIVFRKV